MKWKFLRLSSAQVKICQISYVNFERTPRFLCKFCIPLQFHERFFLCSFLVQTICTLLNRSPLKYRLLRLSSAWAKFCQIPYANFETTSQFLSKFCIFFQFHERLFLCTFSVQRIYTFLKRSPLKWKLLRFSSAQVKFCRIPYANFETTSQFPSKVCIPLPVLWKITPLYFLSSNNIYFPQKEPIKMEMFETYECSDQNLSNFLCQFWNGKSIPVQILYSSSVSWNITPLHFFSSNNIYFARKEPIKMKILKTFKCSCQNLSNFLCQFWKDTSISLQILYPSSVSCAVIPVFLFSSNNIYFAR